MKLKSLGANKTEVELNENIRVLFSYQTPVAYRELTAEGMMFYVTEDYYSRTTSKHISQWLPKDQVVKVPQSQIDDLVK